MEDCILERINFDITALFADGKEACTTMVEVLENIFAIIFITDISDKNADVEQNISSPQFPSNISNRIDKRK